MISKDEEWTRMRAMVWRRRKEGRWKIMEVDR